MQTCKVRPVTVPYQVPAGTHIFMKKKPISPVAKSLLMLITVQIYSGEYAENLLGYIVFRYLKVGRSILWGQGMNLGAQVQKVLSAAKIKALSSWYGR